MMTQDLARLAEDAAALLTPGGGGARERRAGCTLRCEPVDSPGTNSVQAIRTDDVAATIAAARAWFAERGRARFTWWVGTTARPDDLLDRLRAEGARAFDEEPLVRAMVLDEEPPGPAGGGVEVRRVASVEDLRRAVEIQCAAFDVPALVREQALAGVPGRWEELAGRAAARRYLAFLDGRPAGMAGMERTDSGHGFLLSGCTIPDARRRGVYRALLHARWRDAREEGWLPLIVQAGAMSAPVLERAGLRSVGELRLLLDVAR